MFLCYCFVVILVINIILFLEWWLEYCAGSTLDLYYWYNHNYDEFIEFWTMNPVALTGKWFILQGHSYSSCDQF